MNIREIHESFCEYQATIRNYKVTIITGYKCSIGLLLGMYPDIKDIEQVSFLIAQKFFYIGRSERGWKTATFIAHHKHLNVFFKWAEERELTTSNPFSKIEKPKLEKKIPTRLTAKQALVVMDTAANLKYVDPFLAIRNHAIFAMFLHCGLRKGELLNLKLNDVDMDNLAVHIRR